MRDYFASVFLLSVLFGVLERIFYRERGLFGERTALTLMLVLAIAAPLPSLLSEGGGLRLFPEIDLPYAEGEYGEVTREAVERGLAQEIEGEFSLPEGSVAVRCSGFSFNEMRAERIRVTLSLSAASADPRRIEKYVNSLEMGECEVSFEIG